MKDNLSNDAQTSELLILGDGTIFAHNLTPAMAALLAELNPDDAAMRRRANRNIAKNHPDRPSS